MQRAGLQVQFAGFETILELYMVNHHWWCALRGSKVGKIYVKREKFMESEIRVSQLPLVARH